MFFFSTLGCVSRSQAIDHALAQRRYEKAEQLLEAEYREHPESNEVAVRLIQAHGATGKLERAEALTQELVSAKRAPVKAWIALGRAQEWAHQYDRALECYVHASEADPSDPAGASEAGMRAAKYNDAPAAERYLREAIERTHVRRERAPAEWLHAYALALVHVGKHHEATTAYEECVRAEPSFLACRLGMASVALIQKDFARALSAYEGYLELAPRQGDVWLGKSWVLIELGRFAEAEAALKEAERRQANLRALKRQRDELVKRKQAVTTAPASD